VKIAQDSRYERRMLACCRSAISAYHCSVRPGR
jgi:hypothetical protein